MTVLLDTAFPAAERIGRGRMARLRRRTGVMAVMAAILLATFALTLLVGRSFTPPADVLRVLGGDMSGDAGFLVGQLRLPRAVLSVIAGLSFGLGGVAFQTMLRNPLASPDIIGISSGASAAAVFAIVILSLDGPAVSLVAITAGLAIALLIYALAFKDGVSGTRLILIGIGVSAMLDSVTFYVLSRAPSWDLQEAMRWLTGSVNGAVWGDILPTGLALLVFGALLLSRSRDLETLRLGDDAAAGLGVHVASTRGVTIIAAVGLIAFATSAAGPIAFVAFLAAPIAARIVGRNGSLLVPAALVGAVLVLVADWIGQFALPLRYPVGVVTGALGAPYLLILILRANRAGGSL